MFVEYDWTFGVFRFRFGHVFTDVRGVRSCETWGEVKSILSLAGLKPGKKTDSRTWAIVWEV